MFVTRHPSLNELGDNSWEKRDFCVKQKTREFRNSESNGYVDKEEARTQHLMERNVKQIEYRPDVVFLVSELQNYTFF
jgi:hypothetical protein